MIEIDHYFCGDCIHWKLGKGGKHLPCKRIDHDKIKFAVPWFKTYDANQFSGYICSDFCLQPGLKWAVEHWPGFQAYWEQYVKDWVPYGNTKILIPFCLNGDKSINYKVPLMDFVNGTMIDGNTLKAVERSYYKRSKRSPYGYELVRESIDGVQIQKEG